MTWDDDAKSFLENLMLLRRTPKSDELLDEWSLKKEFGEYIIF